MLALAYSVGLTVVPQQHRLFALVPKLAPVATGPNGSTIYVAGALGAAGGGAVLATTGPAGLAQIAGYFRPQASANPANRSRAASSVGAVQTGFKCLAILSQCWRAA